MDTALPQKIPFNLDRNLAKANCTENQVCTSCDKVVLGLYIYSPDPCFEGLFSRLFLTKSPFSRGIFRIFLVIYIPPLLLYSLELEFLDFIVFCVRISQSIAMIAGCEDSKSGI